MRRHSNKIRPQLLLLDDILQVRHTTIDDFYSVSADDACITVILWKVLSQQVEKCFADTSPNTAAIRRIEPGDRTVSVTLPSLGWRLEMQITRMATRCQGFFVDILEFFEFLFVIR